MISLLVHPCVFARGSVCALCSVNKTKFRMQINAQSRAHALWESYFMFCSFPTHHLHTPHSSITNHFSCSHPFDSTSTAICFTYRTIYVDLLSSMIRFVDRLRTHVWTIFVFFIILLLDIIEPKTIPTSSDTSIQVITIMWMNVEVKCCIGTLAAGTRWIVGWRATTHARLKNSSKNIEKNKDIPASFS